MSGARSFDFGPEDAVGNLLEPACRAQQQELPSFSVNTQSGMG